MDERIPKTQENGKEIARARGPRSNMCSISTYECPRYLKHEPPTKSIYIIYKRAAYCSGLRAEKLPKALAVATELTKI